MHSNLNEIALLQPIHRTCVGISQFLPCIGQTLNFQARVFYRLQNINIDLSYGYQKLINLSTNVLFIAVITATERVAVKDSLVHVQLTRT